MQQNSSRSPLRLRLIGTGTPAPRAERAGACCLLEAGANAFLVDCGPGSVRRLIEAGISSTSITHLFLTHLHYDHCMDYAYLALLRWDQGGGQAAELPVFGPAPLERMTQLLFKDDGVYGPDLRARIQHPCSQCVHQRRGGSLPRLSPRPQVTELADGSRIQINGWEVAAAEMLHVQPYLTTLAYRFAAGGLSIVFSADTAPNPRLTALAKGAEVLIHMCHFLNGVERDARLTASCSGHLDAARTAAEAGVKTLVLVHMAEHFDDPGTRERALDEAAGVFKGRIVWGEDLLDIPLRNFK